MTTIAYKAGFMASDSAWSDNGTILTRKNKIVRLSSGALLGSAGDDDCRDVEALFDKVKTVKGLPSRKQLIEIQLDYVGILVLPKGQIIHISIDWDEHRWSAGLFVVGENFAAVGSGRDCAKVAMECGLSAKDAVHMACKYDTHSCPPVYNIPLEKPK